MTCTDSSPTSFLLPPLGNHLKFAYFRRSLFVVVSFVVSFMFHPYLSSLIAIAIHSSHPLSCRLDHTVGASMILVARHPHLTSKPLSADCCYICCNQIRVLQGYSNSSWLHPSVSLNFVGQTSNVVVIVIISAVIRICPYALPLPASQSQLPQYPKR